MIVDFGKKTITDKMNEQRFMVKFYTFILTASLTCIGVNLFILKQSQMFQTPINKITLLLDIIVMALIMFFFCSVLYINVKRNLS
jgi:hypothetical protein